MFVVRADCILLILIADLNLYFSFLFRSAKCKFSAGARALTTFYNFESTANITTLAMCNLNLNFKIILYLRRN